MAEEVNRSPDAPRSSPATPAAPPTRSAASTPGSPPSPTPESHGGQTGRGGLPDLNRVREMISNVGAVEIKKGLLTIQRDKPGNSQDKPAR